MLTKLLYFILLELDLRPEHTTLCLKKVPTI